MTINASTSNWTTGNVASSQNPTIALPTAVPAGATIVVNVYNRTNNTDVPASVSDPTNGAYTLCSGPTQLGGGSTGRVWQYRFDNSAAIASPPTITVSWTDGAVSTQMHAGWISSDLGALTFDGAATPAQFAPTTSITSNAVNATGAGCLIGWIGTNNSQATAPTTLGTDESVLKHDEVNNRSATFLETYAAAGSRAFTGAADGGITLAASATVAFLVGAFLEPGSATPTITDISDATLTHGQTGVTLTGTGFGSTQGTGRVVVSPTDNIADGSAVDQTVTAWGDTSITFTADLDNFGFTTLYVFVENDDDESNADGEPISRIVASATLDFTGANAFVNEDGDPAQHSGMTMYVWRAPRPPSSVGTPDEIITSVATDASGELSQSINIGSLDDGDTVFYVLFAADGTDVYSAGEILPDYA